MESKEFGLVAAQQLFQLEDLHYGFWEKGEIPSISRFAEAQNQHTAFLFKFIEEAVKHDKNAKMLDIGCGIGITTTKLLELGYRVEGLVPSAWMSQQARTNTEPFQDGTRGEIYQCRLEDFPISGLTEKYPLAFFSESFQYVDMQKGFQVLNQILSDTGTVIIFDFFRRDDVTGKSPLGGGHSIGEFYQQLKNSGYRIETDLEVTEHLSPNLRLVNDILVDRVIPFGKTLDEFLSSRHRFLYRFLKYLFRLKLKKMRYKYSQQRNEENFQKFKTYRLLVLKKVGLNK